MYCIYYGILPHLFLAFDDDEDDLMIVEEKDALDVPDQIEYLAGEEIIEETVEIDDYAEIVCVSPKYLNQISNSSNDDNSKEIDVISVENESIDNNECQLSAAEPTDDFQNQTEPIYLSDSLSCFDSDSETQDSQIPVSSVDESEQANISELSQQTGDDDGPLNESTDDVIIVPESSETIEIDRSDSDDNRFASAYSFEMCVESDSQLSQSFDSEKTENLKNGFISECVNSQLYESTTDADDDSSEVEKRNSRTRRDNILRKNYSCRRNYSKRKNKNDSEIFESTETKNDDDSSSQHTPNIDDSIVAERVNDETSQNNQITVTTIVQDSNTTDCTDDENNLNVIKTKTIRTYVRRKPTTVDALTVNELVISKSIEKSSERMGSDSHSENTTSSNDIDNKVIETNPAPRKRGRPRKHNPAYNFSSTNKSQGITEIESKNSSINQLPFDLADTHNIIDKGTNQSLENSQFDITIESELSVTTINRDETVVNEEPMEIECTESKIIENTVNVEIDVKNHANVLEKEEQTNSQVISIDVNSSESQPPKGMNNIFRLFFVRKMNR